MGAAGEGLLGDRAHVVGEGMGGSGNLAGGRRGRGEQFLPEQNFAYYCPSAAARAGGGSGRGQAGMTRCRNDEPFLK